ncbi:MAG: hypothetical protein Q4F95_08205 [Oscillospiraceae bacterium]|nr:hypothetical protein [Oscillospiraceae bacterium]
MDTMIIDFESGTIEYERGDETLSYADRKLNEKKAAVMKALEAEKSGFINYGQLLRDYLHGVIDRDTMIRIYNELQGEE